MLCHALSQVVSRQQVKSCQVKSRSLHGPPDPFRRLLLRQLAIDLAVTPVPFDHALDQRDRHLNAVEDGLERRLTPPR